MVKIGIRRAMSIADCRLCTDWSVAVSIQSCRQLHSGDDVDAKQAEAELQYPSAEGD